MRLPELGVVERTCSAVRLIGSWTLRRGADSGVIEETARFDESYAPIPLKHLTSCQIERLKMNDRQKKEQDSGVRDQEIRAALDQHWAASDANDFETEHRIYLEDAVLEYPQSGERTRGRSNIQNQRASQPNKKRFTIRRIIGGSDLWITELILAYDGKPSYTVSIMEFRGDKVARETQYFADPFVAPSFRAQWVERMDT
jgi:ketosteroid isomerase-like protein